MTIWEARSLGVKQLQKSQKNSNGRLTFSSPSLDCDCLLSFILDKDRSFLLAHNQDFLDSDDESAFFELLEHRMKGRPIAYLVGKKEFYGFDFAVTDDVLIPKADTEILVETAVKLVEQNYSSVSASFSFADICTGSGCIAISILKTLFQREHNFIEAGKLRCHCTDISKGALGVAKNNAQSLLSFEEQGSIHFFEGDLLKPLQNFEKYDLIVSNPPYVPSCIVDELLQDGRGEPRIALDGDVDDEASCNGLSIIERLIPQVWNTLKAGGWFLIETGEYNAEETLKIMKNIGFEDCKTYNDLSGQPRVSYGRKP